MVWVAKQPAIFFPWGGYFDHLGRFQVCRPAGVRLYQYILEPAATVIFCRSHIEPFVFTADLFPIFPLLFYIFLSSFYTLGLLGIASGDRSGTMATATVTQTVLSTVIAASTSAAMAAPSAPPQAGVLEGANPSIYHPKDPIITFIIQVRWRSVLPFLSLSFYFLFSFIFYFFVFFIFVSIRNLGCAELVSARLRVISSPIHPWFG